MSELGKIGDKVGYTLLKDLGGKWVDVDDYHFDTIGQAVAMLNDYQDEDPDSTFAVGRLELAVISRPTNAKRVA